VNHDVIVKGVSLTAKPVGEPDAGYWREQPIADGKPALLQMNAEDFPARFLTALAASGPTPGSSIMMLPTSSSTPVTLYQPVHRVLNVTLLQAACEALNTPRLDPKRVDSAGLVIRRIVLSRPDSVAAWVRRADGQFRWVALDKSQELEDPDPSRRPQLQSGQPELDRLLSLQTLSTAMTEVYTPAFVAPPAVCETAGRTLVFAVIPTASSEVSNIKPPTPQYDPHILAKSLPALLRHGRHSAPMRDQQVDYRYMSDDYAKANRPSNTGSSFTKFSVTLRMMSTVFGAFDSTAEAQGLIDALNKHNVYVLTPIGGTPVLIPQPMGAFYQQAVAALIDYDPISGGPVPSLTMPNAWDPFTHEDEKNIVDSVAALLQLRSAQVTAPIGRFQDASRLYRIRVFLRIKSDTPGCPPILVWSKPSNPFRIAAWHESAGRMQPPVPLPDPTDANFLKNAKPNCFFAVPGALMNAVQNTSLSGLSSGSAGPASGGLQLNWICGFNIPLITICAFFVLNIFLILLNLVFFWLPIIKICIPFPLPTPANSGDDP
jgi:hypothetical protein